MIKLDVLPEEIKKCKEFASAVVSKTYDRFKKDDKEREDRIFFGKLGEVLFLKLLNSRGINPNVKEMFEIWNEITKGDKFDFETKNGETIDIKTAYKDFHKRIVVPYDQFENGKNKDFYVGVKIDELLTEAEIHGFCSNDKLSENGKQNFGEGDAYWEFLDKLKDIEELIKQF